ncbi:MAG: HAMP domain-containing protein [Anaerolineaceae bacterium]|nr:HAMP domain-containing protein [Anaerolineaceae bacterium]
MFKLRYIRTKIMLGGGLSILIVAIALTSYAAITMRNKAFVSTKELMITEAKSQASFIDADLEIALDTSRALANAFSSQITDKNQLTREQVNLMLKQVLEQNPSFFGISTEWEDNAFDGKDATFAGKRNVADDGHFSPYWYRDGDSVALTYLPRLADDDPAYIYYVVPKATMQEAVMDPYIYPVDGVDVLMTSLMVPIIHNNKFYGTVGVDLKLDLLQDRANALVEEYPNGTLTIYSNSGYIAGFTNKPELIGEQISVVHTDWEQDLVNIQSGEVSIDEDEETISVFAPIYFGSSPSPWAVNFDQPYAIVATQANQGMWLMIVIEIGLIVLSLAVLSIVSNIITKPIKKLTASAEAFSNGNLQEEIQVTTTDEIGVLATAFKSMQGYLLTIANAARALADNDLRIEINALSEEDELGTAFEQMVKSLRRTIGDVSDQSNLLDESAGQLAITSSQAREATSQIANTMQQIASGTVQQADSVNRAGVSVGQMTSAIDDVANGAQQQATAASNAADITNMLSAAIQQVAGNAQGVLRESKIAAESAQKGSQKVEDTLTGMQNIKKQVGVSADKVREMGDRSDKIGDIVVTIDDISSQTNLLALNAAIEAARAGEAGKGFAVVADEVRKLAERSSTATSEIGDLVKTIQQTVKEAVQAMEEGTLEVENGVTIANEAGVALYEILSATNRVNAEAEQAVAASDEMEASADELVSAVDMVSSVIEQNTAATEQMSAGSSNVTESIENIASVSEENSAAVEEVSASAEEMSAQVEEVSTSAESLSQLAQKFREVVMQFKLPGMQQEAAEAEEESDVTDLPEEPEAPEDLM